MDKAYVNGYDAREIRRLKDQANTLVDIFHSDTFYPDGSRISGVGCGIGAHTVTLARNSTNATFLSLISLKIILQKPEEL